jgi:hypothetical protein
LDVLSRSVRILAAATGVIPVQIQNTAPIVKPLVALLYVKSPGCGGGGDDERVEVSRAFSFA